MALFTSDYTTTPQQNCNRHSQAASSRDTIDFKHNLKSVKFVYEIFLGRKNIFSILQQPTEFNLTEGIDECPTEEKEVRGEIRNR